MFEDPIHVLFCSADPGFAQAIIRALGPGFEFQLSEKITLENGRRPKMVDWADVLLLDLRGATPENQMDPGLHFAEQMQGAILPPPLVAILGTDDHLLTLKMMEQGAYDVLSCPPNILELRLILRRAYKSQQTEREASQLRSQQPLSGGLYGLVGASDGMQEVFALAGKIAPCDVNVLITGETGTGKELLARAIHKMSSRAALPFVAFSGANLPETLIEDELFGHEKGAFTGALTLRRGRLEMADRGTLFLDEIGDLSLGLQPKLLRVLQERTFERLGGNTGVTVNIRLICATNRDLTEMVGEGKFREDLYYRLNVLQLHLPPLRERRDDIPVLAQHFLHRFSKQFGKKSKRFSRAALAALEEHAWAGNVRELENVVQRAVVLADAPAIDLRHLPAVFQHTYEKVQPTHGYEKEVREFKRRLILRTLQQCGWQKSETARTLGMARNYLHRLITQLEIRPEPEGAPPAKAEPPVPAKFVM